MVFPRPKEHAERGSRSKSAETKSSGRNSPPSKGVCGIADLKMGKSKPSSKETSDEPENGGFKLDIEAAAVAATKKETSSNGGSPKSTQSRGVDTASSAPIASITAIGSMMVDGTKKAHANNSSPSAPSAARPGFGIGGVLIGIGDASEKPNNGAKTRRQTNRKIAAIFGLATALVLVALLCGLLFFVYARHRCDGGIGGPFEALFGGSSASESSKGLKITKKYYGGSSFSKETVSGAGGDRYQSDQGAHPHETSQGDSPRFNRPPKTNEPFLQKRIPAKTSTTSSSTTTTSRSTSASTSAGTTVEATISDHQSAVSRAENFVMSANDGHGQSRQHDWQPSDGSGRDVYPQRRPPYPISNSHQGRSEADDADGRPSRNDKPIFRFRT